MKAVAQTPANVKSPFTGGQAMLMWTLSTLPYQGEKYEVMTEFYRCKDTGEEFATVEQEAAAMHQVRVLHGRAAESG